MESGHITTLPDTAPSLARTLIEERLAACVNRLPVTSTYRWAGEVVAEEEVLLLAKKTDERYPELLERVESDYPHEVPCIERFEEADVLPAFAEWVADATQRSSESTDSAPDE